MSSPRRRRRSGWRLWIIPTFVFVFFLAGQGFANISDDGWDFLGKEDKVTLYLRNPIKAIERRSFEKGKQTNKTPKLNTSQPPPRTRESLLSYCSGRAPFFKRLTVWRHLSLTFFFFLAKVLLPKDLLPPFIKKFSLQNCCWFILENSCSF